jgi:hypothetical protein
LSLPVELSKIDLPCRARPACSGRATLAHGNCATTLNGAFEFGIAANWDKDSKGRLQDLNSMDKNMFLKFYHPRFILTQQAIIMVAAT